MNSLLVMALGACWGSFLNVVAYRGLRGQSLKGRSRCINCYHQLAWYDLIPVISWFSLNGRCRYCSTKISVLYPAVEILTTLAFVLLWLLVDHRFFLVYATFFSALIVTFRTDSEDMLIMRQMTMPFVGLAILFSFFNLLEISFFSSVAGAAFGASLVACINYVYRYFRRVDGMGSGDLELLAMIGAFIGPQGVWLSLFGASCLASVCGLWLMAIHKTLATTKLPFGAFLAISAISYVLLLNYF